MALNKAQKCIVKNKEEMRYFMIGPRFSYIDIRLEKNICDSRLRLYQIRLLSALLPR